MDCAITVRVQTEDFDVNAEIAKVRRLGDTGAVVTFSGICRPEGGRLEALELEHYSGMAEAEIGRIARDAAARWPLAAVTVIHRTGTIAAGQNIVLVVTASQHRQAAFEAASYLMDFMKSRAPFWKKEHLAGGADGEWVNARRDDERAADRWR
jgi:molybdopterin synthase catalytic subunit